jgi:methanogenic corrinoid protein MtbC1
MNYEDIKNAMADLEEDDLLDYMNEVMESGEGVNEAVNAMQEGMSEVGARFESGEYFVGDLIYAGELMAGAMDILKPALAGDSGSKVGRLILCTVKDDLHDIGKNIVRAMLEAAGFDVVDLGIDVPAEKVVEVAKEQNIKIVALSGVLTLALDSMKETVDAIRAAGLDCKIIIGGAPVSPEACAAMGADEWAHSPQKTINVCKAWAAEA